MFILFSLSHSGSIGLAYYEAAAAELSTMDSMYVSATQAGRSVTTGELSFGLHY